MNDDRTEIGVLNGSDAELERDGLERPPKSVLEVQNLAKSYRTRDGVTEAIRNATFSVAPREFVCVVGPSGCGKTTLLKCLAGLLPPSDGEARLRGRRITGPPDELALVFQDYSRSLLPWMSVSRNVNLPLRYKGLSSERVRELTEEALRAVGLKDFVDHYPWQLSGGMQQRVAIARAIAYEPTILLMDEPFASVDAQTRAELEDLLLSIWRDLEVTVVFVTHDIDESVYLSDRVIVLSDRPTTVKKEIRVDLPRPRDQLKTKASPEYAELRTAVLKEIIRIG